MIDDEEYRSWDGLAMAEHIRRGDVTTDELEATGRRLIERLDPVLGAIADRCRPASDDPAAQHDPEAPFAGVPFLVKELLAVPGLPWTMGSRLMAQNPAGAPSAYVRRLLGTGLRVLASTTSSEFGLLGSTESLLRGTTVNPWDPSRSAGGSSGGSAAAVAAGIVPLAHANDAGGSIRYPAAMNGLFGFLPSGGRNVPSAEGDGLVSLVVDHVVTRSVRDSAAVLAATEQRGPHAPFPPIGTVTGPGSERLRIGTLTATLLGREPDPEVGAAVDRTRALLEDLGHHLVDVERPAIDAPALSKAFFTVAALTMASVADLFTPLLGRPPGPDELEPFTLELIGWATTFAPDAAEVADRTFRAASSAYIDLFQRCDVVLSPTVARLPWPLGSLAPDLGRELLVARTGELVGYTPIHNASGCPAMSVPLEEVDGLPVGLHLAAAPGHDARLLELAFELEAARPWSHRRPDLASLEAT